MSRKKPKLDFDSRGGVVVLSRRMIESKPYSSLPATAKVLMLVLQVQWRNDRAVGYGVRQAAESIGCKVNTACKCFKILQERGFIHCANESMFSSKTGSKTREWILTWMPYMDRKPTHDWEKWQPEN